MYSTPQFPLQSDTCIQGSLHCKVWVLVLLRSFPLRSSSTCILASTIVAHIHFLPQEKTTFIKKEKIYKTPVPTEYATGEKLPPSSTPSIPFSSSCPPTSSFSSALSILSSSFLSAPLYLRQFSLRLQLRNSFLVGVSALHASKLL